MLRDLSVTTDGPTPVLVSVKGDATTASSSIERIELDLDRFQSGRWALQLDKAVLGRSGQVVILAQGVAALAVAWWAQLSPRSYTEKIAGAVFLSPLNVGFGQSAVAREVRGPATRLPFPSIVASDPSPAIEQVLRLADAWGSRFVDPSAPAGSRRSNRSPIGSAVEQRLIDLLEVLNGGIAAVPVSEVAVLPIPELAG